MLLIRNAYIKPMAGDDIPGGSAEEHAFAERMANAVFFPVKREMPEKMREELDKYLLKKV